MRHIIKLYIYKGRCIKVILLEINIKTKLLV